MDDPIRRSELRRQARTRLGAQRQRVRMLRRRAIVISLLGFALLWVAVFAQLVSGNDPVLGNGSGKTIAASRSSAKQRLRARRASVEQSPPEEELVASESSEAEAAAAEIEAFEAELAAAAEEPEAVTTSPS